MPAAMRLVLTLCLLPALAAAADEEACARTAVGVAAEVAAGSGVDAATVALLREAARRGCLAASGAEAATAPIAGAPAAPAAGAAVAAGAAPPKKKEMGVGEFMDEVWHDLTHDTKGKYKERVPHR